jgi:hypothetical protein
VGLLREEHNVDELRGEADFAQARDDLLEARRVDGGGFLHVDVGLVLEPGGLDPQTGETRRAG